MQKKYRKCLFCNKEFDVNSEPFERVGKRYAHKTCQINEEKNENSEYKQKKRLEEFICELFKVSYVPPLIQKQIKDFRSLGYSYEGIYFSLFYFYKTKRNPIKRGTIGIVSFVYEEANTYYDQIRRKIDENKDKNKEILEQKVDVIQLKIPNQKPNTKPKKYFKMLEDD